MDLYSFDLDKTLCAYNLRRRLLTLTRTTGVSQYRLARLWWVDGYDRKPDPEGARSLGTAHHHTTVNWASQPRALDNALESFTGRQR